MKRSTSAGLLRVADIHCYLTDTLGPGRRAAVWVQGCSLRCKGCLVPESWNPYSRGENVDPAQLAHSLLDSDPGAHLTVSGGEPTEQAAAVAVLLETAKGLGRNTWVYTGYTLEELLAANDPDVLDMLVHTDVLVDGRFDLERAGAFPYRGSGNQRILRLTDAISEEDANAGRPGRIELLVDVDGTLSFMGIPGPGILSEIVDRLRDRSLSITHLASSAGVKNQLPQGGMTSTSEPATIRPD